MNRPYPIVVVGGPPNSGKSVLVNAITHSLRESQRAHYLLRANPDGEGDWYSEVPGADRFRIKGKYTPGFVARIEQYLSTPVFPLIVDVGGRPTQAEAHLFGYCSQAVLLIGDRADDPHFYSRERAFWQEMMSAQNVPILADIRSVLGGNSSISRQGKPLAGVLTNLERRQPVSGLLFDVLIDELEKIFVIPEEEMARQVLAAAPTEIGLDLVRLARTLDSPDGRWQVEQLRPLLDYLPSGTPLALYGRAPVWVYAALAQLALPENIYLFDARLGWIEPPELPLVSPVDLAQSPVQAGWYSKVEENLEAVVIRLYTTSQYLDIQDAHHLPIPWVSRQKGVVLSGKLANWMWAAAVRQLSAHHPWIAVFQPQLRGSMVVFSRDPAHPIGHILPLGG